MLELDAIHIQLWSLMIQGFRYNKVRLGRLPSLIRFLLDILEKYPDLVIVFGCHPDPFRDHRVSFLLYPLLSLYIVELHFCTLFILSLLHQMLWEIVLKLHFLTSYAHLGLILDGVLVLGELLETFKGSLSGIKTAKREEGDLSLIAFSFLSWAMMLDRLKLRC